MASVAVQAAPAAGWFRKLPSLALVARESFDLAAQGSVAGPRWSRKRLRSAAAVISAAAEEVVSYGVPFVP